jgi:hypothetical protein
MRSDIRNTFRKSSFDRTKALRKLRIQKSLNDAAFNYFYNVPRRVQLDDAYLTCLYRTATQSHDCGTCQECGFIYLG